MSEEQFIEEYVEPIVRPGEEYPDTSRREAIILHEDDTDAINDAQQKGYIVELVPRTNLYGANLISNDLAQPFGIVPGSTSVSMANINTALLRTSSQTISFDDVLVRTIGQCCENQSVTLNIPDKTPVSLSNFRDNARYYKNATSIYANGFTQSGIRQTYIQQFMYDRQNIKDVKIALFLPSGYSSTPAPTNGSNVHILVTSTDPSTGFEYVRLRANTTYTAFRIKNTLYPDNQFYELNNTPLHIGASSYTDSAEWLHWGGNAYVSGTSGEKQYPSLFWLRTSGNANPQTWFTGTAVDVSTHNVEYFSAVIPEQRSYPNGMAAGPNGFLTAIDGATSANFRPSGTNNIANAAYYTYSTRSGSGLMDDGSERFIFKVLTSLFSTTTARRNYAFVCGSETVKTSNHYKIVPIANIRGFFYSSVANALLRTQGHALQITDSRGTGSIYNRDYIQVITDISARFTQSGIYKIILYASTQVNGKYHLNHTRFDGNNVPSTYIFSRDTFVYANGVQANLLVTGAATDTHQAASNPYTTPTVAFGEIEYDYDNNASDIFIARYFQDTGILSHFNIISSRPVEGEQRKPRWTVRIPDINLAHGSNVAYISGGSDHTYLDFKFVIWDKKQIVPGFFLFSTSNLLSSFGTIFHDRTGPSNNTFCTPNVIPELGAQYNGYNEKANIFTVNRLTTATSVVIPNGPSESVTYTLTTESSAGLTIRNDIWVNYNVANVGASRTGWSLLNNYFTLEDITASVTKRQIY
jgi:hypothetical protein